MKKLSLLKTIIILITILIYISSCKKDETIPAPVANYTFTGDNNFAPCKVIFTNTTTNATSYIWDFGDGATSTEQSPNHIYANGGTFNITLTAKNSAGIQNLINKTVTIKNVPTKLKIKSIILSAMPFINSSGLEWDGSSGPDLYLQITDNNNTSFFRTSTVNDISQSSLPMTFTSGFPVTLTNFTFQYMIDCFDEDEEFFDDWDDFIGRYSISIQSNMPIDGNPYPTTIELKSATTQLKYALNVEWLL